VGRIIDPPYAVSMKSLASLRTDLPVVGRLSSILLDVVARERLSWRKIACA
jgi:hypothetical protein